MNLEAAADVICCTITRIHDAATVANAIQDEKNGRARDGVLMFLNARLEALQQVATITFLNKPCKQVVDHVERMDDVQQITDALRDEVKDRNRAAVVQVLHRQLNKVQSTLRFVSVS